MGKVKSEYEKALDEFYQIEDIPEDEIDLEAILGTEYKHVENHFAAKERIKEISEQLLDEYKEAYRKLANGDKKIMMFNTAKPKEFFFFNTDGEVWDYIKEKENPPFLSYMKDPVDTNRRIVNYGNPTYFYIYITLTSKLD